jgi:peptidoglycan/xylan/chitin deacetylase (PgdA/CDA1 family)
VPNIEHYEMFPHDNIDSVYFRTPTPDFLDYSNWEYGNRVGFYRLLDVFDRHEIPITCSLNVAVPDRFPEIGDEIRRRGWEIMSHGIYNSRFHLGLSEAEEREKIQYSIDTIHRVFGQNMAGYFPPFAHWSLRTEAILADMGVSYIVDWGADDQPTASPAAPAGTLLRMPYSFDVNDGVDFRRHVETDDFIDMTLEMFDRLYEDGETTGRVMSLPVHAFILGQPHRIGGLDRLLTRMRSREDVWFATGSQIADWYNAQGESANA